MKTNTKDFLCLLAATIGILIIAAIMESCGTSKKLIIRTTKTTDSSVVQSSQGTHKATTEAQLSIAISGAAIMQKQSGYKAIKVDSGYHVVYPVNDKGYAETDTKAPTIFFLPETASEQKKTSAKKIDKQVKTLDTTANVMTNSAVKKMVETVNNKSVEKTGIRLPWVGIGAALSVAIAGVIWWKFSAIKKLFV